MKAAAPSKASALTVTTSQAHVCPWHHPAHIPWGLRPSSFCPHTPAERHNDHRAHRTHFSSLGDHIALCCLFSFHGLTTIISIIFPQFSSGLPEEGKPPVNRSIMAEAGISPGGPSEKNQCTGHITDQLNQNLREGPHIGKFIGHQVMQMFSQSEKRGFWRERSDRNRPAFVTHINTAWGNGTDPTSDSALAGPAWHSAISFNAPR